MHRLIRIKQITRHMLHSRGISAPVLPQINNQRARPSKQLHRGIRVFPRHVILMESGHLQIPDVPIEPLNMRESVGRIDQPNLRDLLRSEGLPFLFVLCFRILAHFPIAWKHPNTKVQVVREIAEFFIESGAELLVVQAVIHTIA